MAKGRKCARCSTANPEGAITCSNCGLLHGGVVPTGAYTRLPEPLPNTLAMPVPEPTHGDDPAAIEPEATPAAAGVGPEAWSSGIAPVDSFSHRDRPGQPAPPLVRSSVGPRYRG